MKSICYFLIGHKKNVNMNLENYKALKNQVFFKGTEIKGIERWNKQKTHLKIPYMIPLTK